MSIKNNLVVDHIYVLTTGAKDSTRLPVILNELKRIGLIKSKRDDRLSIRYGLLTKMYDKILTSTSNLDKWCLSSDLRTTPQSSCTFSHYLIMHEALSRRFKSVMIVEDDERFLNDIGRFWESIEKLPEDSDFALLDWNPIFESDYYRNGSHMNQLMEYSDSLWVPLHAYGNFGNSGCTIKTDKAMQAFIMAMDSAWYPIDKKWCNSFKAIDKWQDQGVLSQFGIRSYMAVPHLCVQSPKVGIQDAGTAHNLRSWYRNVYPTGDVDFSLYNI